MTDLEKEKLNALEQLLDMTGQEDWHLIHYTVRSDVMTGDISPELEKAYQQAVDSRIRA